MAVLLSRSREQNVVLARRWEQAQEEVDRCHEQIARQAQQNVQLRQQNDRLQGEIEDLVVEHQQLLQRQTEEGTVYERRLESLTAELTQVRRELDLKDDVAQQCRSETDSLRERCFTLEQELAKRIEEVDAIGESYQRLQERYDELYLAKGAEGALRVEVEQLAKDNERLLRMLRGTREY